MLNPESIDYNSGKVKLTFTDENVDTSVIVYLSEEDAWRLSEMIRDKCNMIAKKQRSYKDEKYDSTF